MILSLKDGNIFVKKLEVFETTVDKISCMTTPCLAKKMVNAKSIISYIETADELTQSEHHAYSYDVI